MPAALNWIGIDWGTSNLRCWGLSAQGSGLFAAKSDKGMRSLQPADYPAVLSELAKTHLPEGLSAIPVIVCGMAGAREGWREAPYLPVPASLDEICGKAVAAPSGDTRFNVRILPGLCRNDTGKEDVMRGEETQLLGLMSLRPDHAGMVCLPGTHCKWARVEQGRVVSFHTAMTGELFDVLSKHSVLRHTMPTGPAGPDFKSGIAEGMDHGVNAPEDLSAALFRTRAATLVSGKSPQWCAGYLSGLLVGTEVGSLRTQLQGSTVPVIGSPRLRRLYAQALAAIGVDSIQIDGTKAVLAGLTVARKAIHD